MGLKMEYEIVIGLEVHAELSTNTKIYCSCKNSFGNEVNTNCCEICTGMPGTLPTLNKKVVDYAIKMGLALNCNINQISKQDRKNYFYPDLPKAYQISQFDIPLCENGYVDVLVNGKEKRIGVTRIHIEEDAGKLLHNDSFSGSLVDFNRCGVPLIEIVSEPDMRSSAEAKAYLDTIKSILQTLDISDCKMQEGSIRCDVNVSVRPKGSDKLGTRCEMKNVNSFNGAVHGIEYEAARQIEVIENGGVISQETRRWDDAKGMSFLLRSKEDAHDYRYFPDPDLRTIVIEDEYLENTRKSIPELPNKKLIRLMNEYNLPEFDAGLIASSGERATFFESCAAVGTAQPKNIANWLLGDVLRILNDKNLEISQIPFSANSLVRLAELVEKGNISNTAGKIVIEEMFEGKLPDDIVKEKGLSQISDENALESIVKQVLDANPKSIADYKNGKSNAAGFLVGQCMKLSKGQGNPQILRDILLRMIDASN